MNSHEEFILEFECIIVMVAYIPREILVMLFMKVLFEQLQGWVKEFNPMTV